ncbi:hypothetical protein [Adlercreutzia sp. ZJ141]|uniref:hypothetical protein n=1 Tax=Adlercreutzia sp. ZJ141 TaxID=2709406 RepID=UPI0013EB3FF3|nr:hypothetical protein [Adlercreutzia sp. ZJ141]
MPVELYFAVFLNVRNGLFLGFFYVALGMVFGLRSDELPRLSPAVAPALVAVGLAGCVLLSADQHLPFCAAASVGVFLLSVGKVSPGSGHPVARNVSTVVYLTHMAFVVLLVYGVFGGGGVSVYNAGAQMGFVFVLSLVCSLSCAAVVLPVARRHPAVARFFGI